jgi:hypothetical protein
VRGEHPEGGDRQYLRIGSRVLFEPGYAFRGGRIVPSGPPRTSPHSKRQQDQGGFLNRLIGALRAAQAPVTAGRGTDSTSVQAPLT